MSLVSWVTTHYQFIARSSLLEEVHCSKLIARSSLLEAPHCLRLIAQGSLLEAHCQFIARSSLLEVHYSRPIDHNAVLHCSDVLTFARGSALWVALGFLSISSSKQAPYGPIYA